MRTRFPGGIVTLCLVVLVVPALVPTPVLTALVATPLREAITAIGLGVLVLTVSWRLVQSAVREQTAIARGDD